MSLTAKNTSGRRWLRFRLRTLFSLVAVAAARLGFKNEALRDLSDCTSITDEGPAHLLSLQKIAAAFRARGISLLN